jgi:hypothetical protein
MVVHAPQKVLGEIPVSPGEKKSTLLRRGFYHAANHDYRLGVSASVNFRSLGIATLVRL